MLFHLDVLSPELIPEPRARAVMRNVAEMAGGPPLRPSELLMAALAQNDASVSAALQPALSPGVNIGDLCGQLAASAPSQGGVIATAAGICNRQSFSRSALAALDEFDRALEKGGPAIRPAALEVLVSCILAHMEPADRRLLSGLDVPEAVELLRSYVGGILNQSRQDAGSNGARAGDQRWSLPVELAITDDLTANVAAARGDAYPFDDEPEYVAVFDGICRALHRSQGGHVLLVGERGVGKSTLVTELARRAATGSIPFLADRRFVSIQCRFVPPDESRPRLLAILSHIVSRPELVVAFDGLAAMLRSDRGDNKGTLLSALTQARCRLVGLITPREYDELVAGDADMQEFFTKIEVQEPEPETALRLMQFFAVGLQQRFGVSIDEEVVRQAVLLSANYIFHEQLPAKALSILHQVCDDLHYERAQLGATTSTVTVRHVLDAVSQASGVPAETLEGIAERSDYQRSLREQVVGQDHVLEEVAVELGLIKAGMTDRNKPASVLMFVGQTGTGKTELAKALARLYSNSKRLKTYTLGNFVEPHSVAGIIGVPPGYVGHDQGGRLINDLNADPYSVFLLDEADKAHPDVMQPFLNLFDEGWVSDQRGNRAYADKAIFILTTNVGQRMIGDMVSKGQSLEQITERMKETLSQIKHTKSNRPVFTPEFLARIKRVIVFRPLEQEAMQGITEKLVGELVRSWQEQRRKTLVVPAQVVERIAEESHRRNDKSKGREGGRIVRKLIAQWLEAPLQRELTRQPETYRQATHVEVELVPSEGDEPPAEPELKITMLAEAEPVVH